MSWEKKTVKAVRIAIAQGPPAGLASLAESVAKNLLREKKHLRSR